MSKHKKKQQNPEMTIRKLEAQNAELVAAKAEFEKALAFAREMSRQNLYNPSNPSSRTTSRFGKYTSDNMTTWMSSPGSDSNQKNLRAASNYLANVSSHYSRLIEYYAGLPTWAYVISPVGFDPTKINESTFRKQYFKATKFLEDMNVEQEMRKAMKVAIRDGAFYGVLRMASGSCFIQKLDPQYCRLCAISDGAYNFAYKMSSIQDESDLDVMFPAEFKQMYSAYKSSGEEYQEVPESIAFCLKADDSVNDYTIPLFSAVMPLLLDIENYKALQETQTELQNYKVVAGEIPTDANGRPLIDWGLVQQYYAHICNALPKQVGAVVAPFKLTSIDFDKSSGVSDVDLVSRSVDNFWSAAGTTPALHGSAITTSGGLKLAITADEMLAFGIMDQAGRVLCRFLKALGGGIYFKLTFLPVSQYNQADMVKAYKEAASFGLAKTYYAAALGIHQYDIAGFDYIEKNISMMQELTPMQSSHTQSAKEAGRPTIEVGNEEDETGRSRDRS